MWGRKKKKKPTIHDESDELMKEMMARKGVILPTTGETGGGAEGEDGEADQLGMFSLPSGGGSRPGTAEAAAPKKEIDWDNLGPTPEQKRLSAAERAAQKVGKRNSKITSVSQMSWANKQKDADSLLFGVGGKKDDDSEGIEDLIKKDQDEEHKFQEAVEGEEAADAEEERRRKEEEERVLREAEVSQCACVGVLELAFVAWTPRVNLKNFQGGDTRLLSSLERQKKKNHQTPSPVVCCSRS